MVASQGRRRLVLGLVAVVAVGLGAVVAGHPAQAAPAAPALVKTSSAHMLVNAQGRAVYVYAPDNPIRRIRVRAMGSARNTGPR
jgi:hypothetical protein